MKSKIVALVICLGLFAAAFSGCDNKPKTTATPAPSGTQSASGDTDEFSYMKSGDVYRLYHWWCPQGKEEDEFTDDSIVSKHRLEVYKGIEAQYGIDYQFVPFQGSYWEEVRSSAYSGSPIADGMHAGPVQELVNHYYYNDLPGSCLQAVSDFSIDFTDEQYFSAEKAAQYGTFDGKVWCFVMGVVGVKTIEGAQVLFVNYENLKAGGYEPEQLYDLVKNNQWTWDKFYEVASACSKPESSVYGLSRWGVSMNLVLSNDTNILQKQDVDGTMVDRFAGYNEKAIKAWDEYIKLYQNKVLSPLDMGTSDVAAKTDFANGSITFMFNYWNRTYDIRLSNPELKYGYLPVPMGPDAKDYVSEIEPGEPFCIFKGISNPNGTLKAMKELYRPIYARDSQENKDLFETQVNEYVFDQGAKDMCYLLATKTKENDANLYLYTKMDYLYTKPEEEDKILLGETTPKAYFESIEGVINTNIDEILRRS